VRRGRLLLVALVGWLLAGLVGAGPAAAHAELVATTPAADAALDRSPAEVTLQFTEPVSLGAGYVRIIDGSGDSVGTGEATVVGATVTVPLAEELADDGYLVTYRVISADSHPISGAFGFVVGDGRPVDASVAGAVDETDPFVAGLTDAARWLGYAGLALGLGIPAFLLLCWPAGWEAARPRRLAVLGAAAIAAGALLAFLLQGPYTAGTGIGGIADPALIGATASSNFGVTLLVRVALALVLLVVLRAAPRRAALYAGAVVGAGLVVTTAAVGHPVAGQSPVLAVTITAIHVAAMALWIGGLVALLAGLLRPGVPAVVLSAAGVSRVWVQQHLGASRPRHSPRRVTAHAFAAHSDTTPAPEDVDEAADARAAAQAEAAVADVRPFRRSVLLEAGLLAVVLALSAVLTGTPPARSMVAQPFAATLPLQGSSGPNGTAQVSVDPAQVGPNTMHVYLYDSGGQLTQPAEIRVTIAEEQQQIGPLEVELAPAGPGHYVAEGLDIPGAGSWTLVVSVRLDEFTATTARTSVPVR
jgi:copper transport protein